MAEHGQVISREGNMVTVRMERNEACAKCRACIAGMTKKEMIIKAVNECNAAEDNWVSIELEESGFLKAVLIMYGIPFAGMFTGFIIGYYIAGRVAIGLSGELAGLALGLIMMLLSFLFIKKREGKWNEAKYTPIARQTLDEPDINV